MNPQRRTLLKTSALAAAMTGIGMPLLARAAEKVKVGYLHTPAVDGQIWTGLETGAFAEQGLDLQMIKFTTGLELFQAMIGGSLDVLSTGAVVSNFPARGQGKVFLVNNVEYATAQLWVRGDAGISSAADLKGHKISTTAGTTAHVFLDRVLHGAGLQEGKDVQIVNQRMTEAVTSFISGAVPAVALWVPFDVTVRQKVEGARMLVDASAFYPQAAIVGGWAARNDYYDKNPKLIQALIKGWVSANDYLLSNTDTAVATLQKKHYPEVPLPELQNQFKASKYFTSAEWRAKYADGTVTKWLQQVTDFFVQTAKIANPVPASTYFDPKPYLDIVKA
ncbi:ABC transporter substrate-binding protein [Bordetella genomosp. 7]|uniref:ABC transporter substrate-binding protein n=1 Tax=Bordetella TaxID=517 RepID=UPI00047AF470|nr:MULTISPECIES: ABC transporter substrate-binding protein [Bordetella]OZI24153.1 ABC transporter substrate-binding protein [Bordetella genomosp. 7]